MHEIFPIHFGGKNAIDSPAEWLQTLAISLKILKRFACILKCENSLQNLK